MNRVPLSKPPPPSDAAPKRSSCLPVLLATIALGASFFLLTFLTTGFVAPLALILLLFFGIVAFHYCVWGWWLGNLIQKEEEEKETQQ